MMLLVMVMVLIAMMTMMYDLDEYGDPDSAPSTS